ncbi:MAG: VTT domain-containing protein [bacterium]|nr:VTT domain-containing protein [bacterium]
MNLEAINNATNYLIELVHTAPSAISGTILFFAAFIEYPLPMFPGDTIMIAGGFFAARGAISIYSVFFMLVLGSICGSISCWYLGKIALNYKWSKKFFYFFVTDRQLQRIGTWYKKYGAWILAINRFIPGVRSAFMFASGIVHMRLKIVIVWEQSLL